MLQNGVILINGIVAKQSKDVKIGDVLEIKYLETTKKYQILKLPLTKTIPKGSQDEYIQNIFSS
jgi:ribosomal 50S subunit-recycling heat shock protein